jgi:predicted AAA+ superfamily ATPase
MSSSDKEQMMSTETSPAKPENSPQLVPFGSPLPPGLEEYLRTTNPWWEGKRMPKPPQFRRWLFEPTLRRFKKGMTPAVVLRGTRQVGKSTLQEQIIYHLLYEEGVAPNRILRIQFDTAPFLSPVQVPLLALSHWFERNVLGETFNAWGWKDQQAYLLFDEAQIVEGWSDQLKMLVDHQMVRVLLTGSSAFKIEKGRDSLAGRITTLSMNTLLLREITALRGWGNIPPLLPFNGVTPLREQTFWEELRDHGKRHKELRDKAFAAFSERGGYPISQIHADLSWEEIAAQLNETVIQRVLRHDLGESSKPQLLEQLLRLACRYAGQSPGRTAFLRELHSKLSPKISWQDVLTQLQLLNDTLLIRLVSPMELRTGGQKGNTDKICLADHSLRASWLREKVPLTPEGLQQAPHLAHLAGFLAESIAGYFFSSIPSLDVTWFPARKTEPEVDLMITIGYHNIPIEVKYRHTIREGRDTKNLRAFLDKPIYDAPFGILLTQTDDVEISDKRIVALPLSSLLLMR